MVGEAISQLLFIKIAFFQIAVNNKKRAAVFVPWLEIA